MGRSVSLVVVLSLALAAFARDSRKEVTVNLKFSPQEGVAKNSPDIIPAALERSLAVRVEDGRTGDAMEIGAGTNDDDQKFPIRASTDVLPYLDATLASVAGEWGVKSAAEPDRVLVLKLNRFFVDESNKAVGSVYTSEVKFTYALTDRAGKKLLEGAASGTATRYGRARSADNCNEVLSDALKDAFANVLGDSRVQEAWSSGRASTGGSGSSAPQESVEERLRKLEDLFKKGLITKEEYKAKREEILKEM